MNALTEIRETARLQNRIAKHTPNARKIISQYKTISRQVDCPHNASHLLAAANAILSLGDVKGAVVEAGCFKGGSTAKLSLVAAETGRDLVVFDSFQGLPDNAEPHTETIDGSSIEGWFNGGAFTGALDEVRDNVTRFGNIEVCTFVEGWFEDTMPTFDQPIAFAYLDVDLAESTRTCLRHLWPLVNPGGVLMSQDGDFPLVIEVFREWATTEGVDVEGLGSDKILTARKPVS